MKLNHHNQINQAMNLLELVVVIACLCLLAMLLLPAILTPAHVRSPRTVCVNNLKQIGLAYRVWSGDNSDKYPMAVSVTNGGAMELIANGDVVGTYLTMTNELCTSKILVCPQDQRHTMATNFDASFGAKNISYFVGVDANEDNPQRILSGDDNLAINGTPVTSGLLELPTNTPIIWTAERHVNTGNIGFADGSALELTSSRLQLRIQLTSLATNHLAIP
jgi:prepilin-type processing-associated H-X9-DG protein